MMAEGRVRVAVSGFGKMGLLHAGIFNALPGSQVVAVADPASTITRALQQYTAVAVHDDFQRMLDRESPDAVVITSPTFLHVEQAAACAERQIPFLVEKPLAARAGDCSGLVATLQDRPVTNAVGFMARHQSTFRQAHRVIQSGVLGELIHLKATMYVGQLFKPGKGWRYDPKVSGGGVLITQNAHLLDLLLWMFGPVDLVSGHTRSVYARTVEDFAHAYLRFSSGLTGFVDTSWSARHYRTVEISIEVQGEHGTLNVNDDEVRLFLDDASGEYPAGWKTWRKPDLYEGVVVDIGGPEYTTQDAQFIEAVAQRGQVDCDVHSAYRVQKLIDGIYASAAESGQPVLLQERNS